MTRTIKNDKQTRYKIAATTPVAAGLPRVELYVKPQQKKQIYAI